MKLKYMIPCLALVVLMSGCSIFKPGCHCPHVVYSAHPKVKPAKNS